MLSATLLGFFSPQASLRISERTLSFAERVSYQRAIEDVYWRHRIWPNERRDPKPPLDSVMPLAQLEKKVADYLCKSQTVEDYWQRPITAEQLQAEMDRIAANTKQPEVLRELFEVLGSDPFVIAECLARPIAAERLVTNGDARVRFNAELKQPRLANAELRRPNYTLPVIAGPLVGCTQDTWTPTSLSNAPSPRVAPAVWTGSEMIVWGGTPDGSSYLNTGARTSYHRQLDSHQHNQCARCPVRAYGSVDWQ